MLGTFQAKRIKSHCFRLALRALFISWNTKRNCGTDFACAYIWKRNHRATGTNYRRIRSGQLPRPLRRYDCRRYGDNLLHIGSLFLKMQGQKPPLCNSRLSFLFAVWQRYCLLSLPNNVVFNSLFEFFQHRYKHIQQRFLNRIYTFFGQIFHSNERIKKGKHLFKVLWVLTRLTNKKLFYSLIIVKNFAEFPPIASCA